MARADKDVNYHRQITWCWGADIVCIFFFSAAMYQFQWIMFTGGCSRGWGRGGGEEAILCLQQMHQSIFCMSITICRRVSIGPMMSLRSVKTSQCLEPEMETGTNQNVWIVPIWRELRYRWMFGFLPPVLTVEHFPLAIGWNWHEIVNLCSKSIGVTQQSKCEYYKRKKNE